MLIFLHSLIYIQIRILQITSMIKQNQNDGIFYTIIEKISDNNIRNNILKVNKNYSENLDDYILIC